MEEKEAQQKDPVEEAVSGNQEDAVGQSSKGAEDPGDFGSAEAKGRTGEEEQEPDGNAPGDAVPEDRTQEGVSGETPGEPESEGEGSSAWAEVERLRQEAEDWRMRALRMQADFENFKRRTRQEREEWATSAAVKVIEQFLPILDNLELALSSGRQATDLQSVLQGVEMVARQFREVLEREGVQAIEAVGLPFDPNLHEAVMQVSDPSQPPGTVVEELRKGYRYKDRILRPAMVKVNGETGGN
ncbi:MAG: nucleotide exchange factor GrpE [Alicyclobacillaceae bacterium]|nr:nucleotide exchange factor GrpE [Alicyclobacillaceae bacterium]